MSLPGHTPTSLYRPCNYHLPQITNQSEESPTTPLEAESERELADAVLALGLGWGVSYAGPAESTGVWLNFYCPACMVLGPPDNPNIAALCTYVPTPPAPAFEAAPAFEDAVLSGIIEEAPEPDLLDLADPVIDSPE